MARGCASLLDEDCPIPRAHRRLEDAHRLWHQAAANYADPDAFRLGLNGALHALRGGTWALQQATRAAQDFQAWHDRWHARIRGDQVLHWLVQTHRHTVTEDDLGPASSARVTLMAKQNGGDGKPLAAFTVPPLIAAEAITRQLGASRMGALMRQASFMVVERQWRSGDLQDWDLMDALAHCYAVLAEPLHDAHRRPGHDPVPDTGQPECMTMSAGSKMAVFRLDEGRLLGPEQRALEGEEGRPDLSADPAGTGDVDDAKDPVEPDPLRRTAWYFEDARRKLAADGAYAQRVSLFVPGQEWISVVLAPADLQDRYKLWSRVAREVERTGAEAVLTIFEMGGRRGGEGQRLVLAAETMDGRHRTFSVTVERRGGHIQFGRTRFDEDGRRWYFLDPIREVWNKPK